MKKITLLAAVTALALNSICAHADTLLAPSAHAKMDGENKIVALYGNLLVLYNNNINIRLRGLMQSLLPNHAKGYKYRGITISSGHLGWRIENMRYQNALQKWDIVVLQRNSTETISKKESTRQNFVDSAIQMAEMAHKTGTKVVCFMTWPEKARPEGSQKLADAYILIAQKTGGYVVPVGLAFEKACKTHPEINLYYYDGVHPSISGAYLAACVFFATLYNRSPVGGALPVDTGMTSATAKVLQQVAWETVTEFQKS